MFTLFIVGFRCSLCSLVGLFSVSYVVADLLLLLEQIKIFFNVNAVDLTVCFWSVVGSQSAQKVAVVRI